MKPILTIFTGGTIGTIRRDDGIMSLSHSEKYELIEHYRKNNDDDIEIVPIKPMNVLSEHMRLSDINTLIDYLKTVNFDDYSGIIITHGTDTLAYTANILGILLNNMEIPIVIVSSNLPLNDENCDGHMNFEYAIRYIKEERDGGVFVMFKDITFMHIHLATRVLQSDPFTDEFRSVGDEIYDNYFILDRDDYGGELDDYGVVLPSDINETLLYNIKKPLESNVLFIKPYTGLNYSNINIKGYKAVLVEAFHSGTVNGNEDKDEYSIFSLINSCKDENIPIYIAPIKYAQKAEDASMYEGLSDIYNMVTPIYGTSAINAYCKLIVAMSLYDDIEEINTFLQMNINNERIVGYD